MSQTKEGYPNNRPLDVEIRLTTGQAVKLVVMVHRKYLCVNRSPNGNARAFNLTHMPTGMAIRTNLPKFVAFRMLELLADMTEWKDFIGQDSVTPWLAKRVKVAQWTAEREYQGGAKPGVWQAGTMSRPGERAVLKGDF